MFVCSNEHDEVRYDCENCPVCELRRTLQCALDDLNSSNLYISNYEQKHQSLEDEVTRLQNDLLYHRNRREAENNIAQLRSEISDLEREIR